MKSGPRLPQLEKALAQKRRPNTAIKKKKHCQREISSVLFDHLEGWDREGGREAQERGNMGIYVYI